MKKSARVAPAREKSRVLPVVLYLLAVLILVGLIYYVTLPPMNIHSGAFWTFVLFLLAVVFVSYYIIGTITGKMFRESTRKDTLTEESNE